MHKNKLFLILAVVSLLSISVNVAALPQDLPEPEELVDDLLACANPLVLYRWESNTDWGSLYISSGTGWTHPGSGCEYRVATGPYSGQCGSGCYVYRITAVHTRI